MTRNAFKKFGLEIFLHLLFWLFLFQAIGTFTTLTVKYLDNTDAAGSIRAVKISLYPLTLAVLFFLMALFYLNSIYLLTTAHRFREKYPRLVISFLFFPILYFANFFLVNQFIALSTLKAVQWKHLQGNIVLLFGFVWGFSFAYFYFKEWVKNEVVKRRMEAHQLSTELNFLKSQINPHFLFNTLNNLFSLAQENGNNELANGIAKLSDMMRYMLYESNAEKVPLKKEINNLKSFIMLNKLRYDEEEVKIAFSYPEKCDGESIAPMVLLPFVENAFKYGIRIHECSVITIGIKISDAGIFFYCENNDNAPANNKGSRGKGIGLENVRRRLELIYPKAHTLIISQEDKKYSVTLQLFKKC